MSQELGLKTQNNGTLVRYSTRKKQSRLNSESHSTEIYNRLQMLRKRLPLYFPLNSDWASYILGNQVTASRNAIFSGDEIFSGSSFHQVDFHRTDNGHHTVSTSATLSSSFSTVQITFYTSLFFNFVSHLARYLDDIRCSWIIK